MTVKAIVDAARAVPAYAGVAIFSAGDVLFIEHIGPDYAVRLCSLFGRICGEAPAEAECLCAVTAGFTFYIYRAGDFILLLRISGRFSARPQLVWASSDYIDPVTDVLLPARAQVHREAEALLRQYDFFR